MCRASIPVFTCLLSIVFERKIPSKQEGFALFVLTLGVMIAMWRNNAAGSPFAIGLCLIGTICNAGMMSMSGKVLSEKVDALQLAFYTAPVSFSAIMPVFLYREVTFWTRKAIFEVCAVLSPKEKQSDTIQVREAWNDQAGN